MAERKRAKKDEAKHVGKPACPACLSGRQVGRSGRQVGRSVRSPRRVKKSNKQDASLMTIGAVAKMLKVDIGAVRSHIAAGAPVGPDESINLFHYAAWLIREMTQKE